MRTQPVRTWVTLTGDARAVAAAFGDATDGDDGSAASRSPLRKRLRRTPVVSFSSDSISSPSDDADPVPSAPSVPTPGAAGRRRRGGLRRCSSVASEDEFDAATGDAAVVTPLPQQTHTDAHETNTAAVASSWILPPQRRRLTPPKNPFDAFDFKHDDDSENDCSTTVSFLSPQRRRASPSGAGDEPLRSPTEELSALSLGSDEDDEMMPALSPPSPSPCFAEDMAPTVAPKRRRGGLTRSMAGRFRMGEGGGLEADCST